MIQPHKRNRQLLCRWITSLLAGAALITGSVLDSVPLQAETWTSLRGTHAIEAKMVGLWSGNVILELSNGRRVSVKLSDLRSESRIQAQELSRELDASRGERVNELQGQASTAAAPAPDPLPVPPKAPAYFAPQPDQTAENFFAQLDSALQSGHILAIYDSLPPSYRKDIGDVVKSTAERMDAASWQSLVGTAQRLGDLVVTRQRWLLSSPQVLALPAEQVDVMEGPVLTFAGLLRIGLSPEAMDLQKLQSTDFGQWLAERDAAMAPYLAQLVEQMGTESLREVTIESEANGQAVASIDIGGVKTKVTYTQVEGYWVPKSLADSWTTSVEQWKQGDSPLATSMLAAGLVMETIAPSLDNMSNASDAGAFHAALASGLEPAETIAAGVAALLGKSMDLASNTRQQGGYGGYDDYSDGYGDDYGDDMDGMDDYGDDMEGMDDYGDGGYGESQSRGRGQGR